GVNFVGRDRFERANQFGFRIGLEQVAASAGFESAAYPLNGVVQSEKKNLGVGLLAADDPGGFEAADAGHGDVHQYNVGLQLRVEGDGFFAGAGFARDFPVRPSPDNALYPTAKNCVVVDHQNTIHDPVALRDP